MNAGRVRAWMCVQLRILPIAAMAAFLAGFPLGVQAQGPEAIPTFNVGGNAMEAQFARLDFAQMYLEQQNRAARDREQNQKLVAEGTVSVLDLAAPGKAVNEFNKAAALLTQQHSKQAIPHLQKAIAAYPKFVSAHNDLGLAYMELEDSENARSEFEKAVSLDDKFPGSFLNLGRLALMQKDFARAKALLERAASLRPRKADVLTVLAYAENGAGQYQRAIETAGRVHALEHKGMANVHYIAASAAISLDDFPTAQRELEFFVREDPANPLAPIAHQDLAVLARRQNQPAQASGAQPQPRMTASAPQTFPNTARLRDQLSALGDEKADTSRPDSSDLNASPGMPGAPASSGGSSGAGWVIRKTVDEVAIFFSVTSHGHLVTGLGPSDIHVLDDHKPPLKVLQFAPSSALPLRLGMLIDASGSVNSRFSFEKHAAIDFVHQMLRGSDLGFIEGFANAPLVSQDFTGDQEQLAGGINQLRNEGGTALFDAVSFACWKLAAYPEQQRVARVLVVLSDGEDNSSHGTLKQAIQDAEAAGVTVYTISTKTTSGPKTDADHIMEALAEHSGGEAMFPVDMYALRGSFNQLRDLIRSRYLLAYKPADFVPDGRYRAITIAAERDGKRLQVHSRSGYHARVEPQGRH